MSGMDIWDAAKRMAEAIHARGLVVARLRKERRNRLRRETYAIKRRLGIPTRKPKPEPVVEREPEPLTACYCATTRMPPCGWCESGNGATP